MRIITVPHGLSSLLPDGVTCEADMYHLLAQAFEEFTGLQMPYYGESGGLLYMRFLKALLMPARKNLAVNALKRMLDAQQHKCWECGEKVTAQSYDVHHKKRLSLSAGEDANSPTNLAILCRCCHARHTEAEQLALGDKRSLTIEFQVSTRMKHLLDSTSPPPQIVWGQREKAKRTPPSFREHYADCCTKQ